MDGYRLDLHRCPTCQLVFERAIGGAGRPRKYCGRACSQKAYELRKRADRLEARQRPKVRLTVQD